MPETHLLNLSLDNLMQLAEQPLKLTEFQLNILIARYRLKQQEKLDYHPDFSTEELVRKAIRNLALVDGALETFTNLIEETLQPTVEKEE